MKDIDYFCRNPVEVLAGHQNVQTLFQNGCRIKSSKIKKQYHHQKEHLKILQPYKVLKMSALYVGRGDI